VATQGYNGVSYMGLWRAGMILGLPLMWMSSRGCTWMARRCFRSREERATQAVPNKDDVLPTVGEQSAIARSSPRCERRHVQLY
jgi:hypothetical protein